MTFWRAISYFFREACSSLVRSWKVSLLAITTITMSLFLGGIFLLASGNLRQLIDRWQGESAIVVYLEKGSRAEDLMRLAQALEEAPWTRQVDVVTTTAARQRFRQAFPSLSDLLDGWGEDPLPASLEVVLEDHRGIDQSRLEAWFASLQQDAAVSMIDDDRDWLSQVEAVVFALQALGMILGAILLTTAIFTISSVIRLTAYLYHDEIAVMRLVGATEFYIRGPFYLEGLIQGLMGGLLAISTLAGTHTFLLDRYSGSTLSLLAAKFLSVSELLALVVLGGLAGLVGAVSSLRKETLGKTAEEPGWEGTETR